MAEKFSVLPESVVVPGCWSSWKQHSRVWVVCKQVVTAGRMHRRAEWGRVHMASFGEQMSILVVTFMDGDREWVCLCGKKAWNVQGPHPEVHGNVTNGLELQDHQGTVHSECVDSAECEQISLHPHCWLTTQLLKTAEGPFLQQSPSNALWWEHLILCLPQRRNAQRNFFHYHRVCIEGWIWSWKAINWHMAPRLNCNHCPFKVPATGL